ncbi:histidine phosphatase family protein [Geodermatophilus sabuli]|uniref:Probable phosphoglycerate mutase n=1 Tax=Geodermatophilus sabuli TaxID=1564158 RepID=A0A285E8D4_9ACTN|nr:histidine phosphatase family protein [Geodermatophilus sabuli]MBB3082768.1 putative phosphoglycerate mutase [Geodermatophilus sabuli]SNX94366.1 probable phosphoglycerate mutase [Geodermatophilus sabuli]
MGEIVVLRHGQTEWSLSGQHTGVTDLPLLPEGEEQARRLADQLGHRPFAEVWVSPRQRARRTAELVGLTPTGTDEDLVELDYGAYEGRTTAEISEELGREWSIWVDGAIAGDTPGETLDDVGVRVDRVLQRARAVLDDGDVALVAHGHVLRVLAARWLGLEPAAGRLFALPAGSYGVLGHEHRRPVLTGWGLH